MNEFSNLINGARSSVLKASNVENINSAVILGSGLSNIDLAGFSEQATIAYTDIEGLPVTTAPSHSGELRIVSNSKSTIAICAGRHHLYEGYSAQQVSMLTYLLSALGVKNLILTNAAGALNADFTPGDVMLINDHINVTGQNPLMGQDNGLGTRFPDMSQAYNRRLLSKATELATQFGITHHHGVYAGVTGPSLETSAERRMLRILGADAVGMSTVMEVIAANHCGLKVLGLSAITNLALGNKDQKPDTIEQVLENAAIAGQGIKKIIEGLLAPNGPN